MKLRLIYIVILLLIYACSEDWSNPSINTHNIKIEFAIPDVAIKEGLETYEGINVQLYNTRKDYTINAITDSNGEVDFKELEPGFYQYNTSYEEERGDVLISLNGSGNIEVLDDISEKNDLEVTFEQIKGGNFVIREFYYSGSKTVAGKSYSSDQYIEVYNNSPESLNANKIYLVELESYGYTPNYWSYMQADSIVVKMIWALPESSEGHIIAPGDGFIMARDALNHRSDPNGNPNSPVDLGNADFEFWSDKTTTGDIDHEAPNMIDKLWTYKGSDIAFHTRGGSAIAIVEIPGNVDEYINNNLVAKGAITPSSRLFCKIPNEYVVDAVEVLWDDDETYKRMDISLDSRGTYVAAKSPSGLCVRRKIRRFIEGRAIYQDTNNSYEDFDHDVVPQPGIYK